MQQDSFYKKKCAKFIQLNVEFFNKNDKLIGILTKIIDFWYVKLYVQKI